MERKILKSKSKSKRILKQQHAENAAKSAEIDVSELPKLQNVLSPQPWLG